MTVLDNSKMTYRTSPKGTTSKCTFQVPTRDFVYQTPREHFGSTFEPINLMTNPTSQILPMNNNNSRSKPTGKSATLHPQSSRNFPEISTTLNPKRVSVATSSFWEGHPDMAHLVNHLGMEHFKQDGNNGTRPTTCHWSNVGAAMGNWGWGDPPALKKGILLQQKEKHFLARWKERYCVLTRDYLHCFRRTTSIHRSGVRLSEMGNFLFKLRLADMDGIQLEKRRIGTVISIIMPNEPKILFKVVGEDEESTQQWYTLLQECLYTSKERRLALRTLYSTGTEASRNCSTIRNGSLYDGSPTNTSSSTNSSNPPTDVPSESTPPPPSSIEDEDAVLIRRRESPGKKTNLIDLIASNRHSVSITDDYQFSTLESTIGEEDENDIAGTSRRPRPESWAPQQYLGAVSYRTPTLIPSSGWLGNNQKRANVIAGPGAPTFSRASSHLYSTSRHTSEITFRKMS